MPADPSFFTVADDRFFVGVVCLVNSLRLTGNGGDIVVIDLGLTPDQRRRLAPHVRLVEPPPAVRRNPQLLKPSRTPFVPEA